MSEWIGEIRPRSRYPYSFPYFLFPPKHKNPIVLASQRSEIITAHEVYAPSPSLDSFDHFNDTTTQLMHHSRNSHYNHSMHKFSKHNENVNGMMNVGIGTDGTYNSHAQKIMRKEFHNFGKTFL